jgi:two-component sensor histidine kinase
MNNVNNATLTATDYSLGTLGTARRDYWLCQLAGWGSFAVVAVLSSSQGSTESVLRFTLAKIACMITGLGLSHLWHQFLRSRGWLDRNRAFPFLSILAGISLLAVLQLGCLLLADLVFRHGALFDERDALPIVFMMLFFIWFATFLVWTLCYAMVLSRRRALRFELEKLELEVSVKDAELRALQAQINPHFFFNSLNSIRALIYQDADSAARAVSQLAGMMRHTLQAGQASTVRLADELAAVDAYLGMEKLRFDERLQLSLAIEPGLDDVAMPPMILQTLVENAVKHGVERSMDACRITIGARREGGKVLISVANQGTLAEASASTRLGLANASKRLALLFGPASTCTLTQQDGAVVATIVLPQVPA